MISPTCAATSSPTTSMSSMGPIGIPKLTAQRSMTSSGVPSWAASIASNRYGVSTRFTMKPGALRHGTGSLSRRRAKPVAVCTAAGSVRAACTNSMSGICATGLKKCSPTSRSGCARRSASGSSMMLEVLVASSAPGFIRGSSRAYSSCLAARFSKIASITRSADATPSPGTSARRRARCARRARSR